jgi:hypothetical protein
MLRWFSWIFDAIRRWRRRRKRRRAFDGVVRLESSVDPASALVAGNLVLIGPKDKPKWLRFRCPCGCGGVIALNLMATHYPRWAVRIYTDGTLTVMPSVDAETCGSHFWIRRSQIKWV